MLIDQKIDYGKQSSNELARMRNVFLLVQVHLFRCFSQLVLPWFMSSQIGRKLKEMGISPSLLNWGDEIVSSTKIWYDEESSELRADCGVSITVDDSSDIAQLLIDIEDAIIKHYSRLGIILESSYI